MSSERKTAEEMLNNMDGVGPEYSYINRVTSISLAEMYAKQEVVAERQRLGNLAQEEITELRAEVARLRKEANKRHREDQKWVARQVAAAVAEETQRADAWKSLAECRDSVIKDLYAEVARLHNS